MEFPDFLLYLHCGAASCCKTIFDYLTLSDIHSLRLTANPVKSVASAYYSPFSRIYISTHPADLTVFREIAGNPRLASQVEEIVWDDTTFSRTLLDFNIYKQLWARQPIASEPELNRYHEVYVRMAREQLEIRDAQQDFEALVQALPRLPRLKRVILTRLSFEDLDDPDFGGIKRRSSPAAKQWRKISPILRTFMIEPDVYWVWSEWYSFGNNNRSVAMHDTFDPKYASETVGPSLDPMVAYLTHDGGESVTLFHKLPVRSGGPAPVYAPFRGLVLLTQALRQTRTRVQEFHITNLYDQTEGMPVQIFSHCNPTLPSLIHVLESLTHLSLDIDVDPKFGPDLEKGICRDVFATSLGTAKVLRSLKLKIHDRQWKGFTAFLRSNPIQTSLPCLREVTITSGSKYLSCRKLASLSFVAEDLVDLLRWCRGLVGENVPLLPTDVCDQSRTRLRCLRLENIGLDRTGFVTMQGDLRTYSWKSVLENLTTICSSHDPEARNITPISHWLYRLELCDVVDYADDTMGNDFSMWSSSGHSIMDYLDGRGIDPLQRSGMM